MNAITLFSFGYWGWGSAVPQLVSAIDAVETARGYAPPTFVDVRISRSVRAKGFDGAAFENAVGKARYRWLDALGNLGVTDGGEMRIKDPSAAHVLLDLAVELAEEQKRLVFFCACEVPCQCHRSEVARLTLQAATDRDLAIQVVEWPGGEPTVDELFVELDDADFEKVGRGAKSIPLADDVSLAEIGAIPWYSVVAVARIDEEPQPWRLMTGPAMYRKSGWYLPVYDAFEVEDWEAVRQGMERCRERDGFQARRSATDR